MKDGPDFIFCRGDGTSIEPVCRTFRESVARAQRMAREFTIVRLDRSRDDVPPPAARAADPPRPMSI